MSETPATVGRVPARATRKLLLPALVLLLPALACSSDEPSAEGTTTDVAVHVATISRATLHRWVTAYGRIEPAPPAARAAPGAAQIGAPVGGLLVSIDCAEGVPVKAGDVLFQLDSRVAEVELTTARRQLAFAEKTYARQKELIAADGTSQRAFEEAEAARDAARSAVTAAETQLDLLQIRAPIAGTVTRIDARLGQPVEANTILAEIVDFDRLVASARISTTEAAGLEPGLPVLLAEDGPAGRLLYVAGDVDPRSDTVLVRASLPPASAAQAGELVTLRILAEERPDRLTVPEESLVTRTDEGEWIVLVEGDRARRVPVSGGLHEDGLVEIDGEGLREGMTVVTRDAYSLPAETAVHVVGP